jgi:protease I
MSLKKMRIAILTAPSYSDLSLHYPYLRFLEAGAKVDVLAANKDTVKGGRGLSIEPDLTFEEANSGDYNAVFVPGGRSPDSIRQNQKAIDFVTDLYNEGKLVVSICHGLQVLISAKILKGKRVNANSGVIDDAINAGAKIVDEITVRDENLITAKITNPKLNGLTQVCGEMIKFLSKE